LPWAELACSWSGWEIGPIGLDLLPCYRVFTCHWYSLFHHQSSPTFHILFQVKVTVRSSIHKSKSSPNITMAPS
jgi:hypothetical protein